MLSFRILLWLLFYVNELLGTFILRRTYYKIFQKTSTNEHRKPKVAKQYDHFQLGLLKRLLN